MRSKSPARSTCAISFLLTLCSSARILAAGVDASALPPPSDKQIEFDRDVRPIFQATCFKCHGADRPKGGFQLTARETALKGGNNYPDAIVPRKSVESKLIHFVAGLVEDMQMPPEGKGEPLTAEQIGILRAWIDQGAQWGKETEPKFVYENTPSVRWISLDGNENKFREIEGIKSGWAGGIEHISLSEQVDARTKLSAEGRYIFDEHDAAFKLALDRRDFGFVHFGLEQWRSYYDDTGGYYRPGSPAWQDLDRGLELDHGRAWVDVGLTLPNWPRVVLGYEYQFRDGEKSMLNWGTVNERKTYPAFKDIDEEVHIVKLDLDFNVGGWEFQDRARVEFYDLETTRHNGVDFSTGPHADTYERTREVTSAVQGANTLRAEKPLRDWWLVSAGYQFTRYDGETRLDEQTVDANNLPVNGNFWNTDDMVLRRNTHVASLANLFLPFSGLSCAASVQGEWTRQEGFGDISLDVGDPNVPAMFTNNPGRVDANLDRARASEAVNMRLTKIPWTVVFGDLRLDQEQTSQYEELESATLAAFERDSDISGNQGEWRAGFTTSPKGWVSFGGHYRRRWSDTSYDHRTDTVAYGYPAFIREREIETDEFEGRLDLKPVRWLRAGLSYRRVKTDYETKTDELPGVIPAGLWLHSSDYDADIYSVQLSFTPWQRLYLGTTFSLSDSTTFSGGGQFPSVAPYEGQTYSVMANGRYALDQKTDLLAAYAFSKSDFEQQNYQESLPLGLAFSHHSLSAGVSRRITANFLVTLRYLFYRYEEPSAGGVNDYTAHGVFLSMNYRWQ